MEAVMLNVILGIVLALIFIGGLNYFLTKSSLKKAAQNGGSGNHNHKSGGHGCCH